MMTLHKFQIFFPVIILVLSIPAARFLLAPTPLDGLQSFISSDLILFKNDLALKRFPKLTAVSTVAWIPCEEGSSCTSPLDRAREHNVSQCIRAASNLDIRIDSFDSYADYPDLADQFLSESLTSQIVAIRYPTSSTGAERREHLLAIQSMCPTDFMGEEPLLLFQEELNDQGSIYMEVITIPIAMIICSTIIGTWKASAFVLFNVASCFTITYSINAALGLIFFHSNHIHMGVKPIVEAVTMAFSIDYALIGL